MSGDQLFLTPLLRGNSGADHDLTAKQLEEIREKARVQNLTKNPELLDRQGYSGYFTVDPAHLSHLFFWFFPAPVQTNNVQPGQNQNPEDKPPLILWLNGGPGHSSLKGVFCENGPFYINEANELEKREFTWTDDFPVLYIDSPVGTGFSFTEDKENGYSRNLADVSRNLLSALRQFYTVFPEYAAREFYIAGESAGGKMVPDLTRLILQENQTKTGGHVEIINLKGFLIGAPYAHPKSQCKYGKFFHGLGLIDRGQLEQCLEIERAVDTAVAEERWNDGFKLMTDWIFGIPNSLFTKWTGYTWLCNYTQASAPPILGRTEPFVDQARVRHSLHVGDTPFASHRPEMAFHMVAMNFTDSVGTLVEMLDCAVGGAGEPLRILLYSSQLDLVCSAHRIKALVEGLEWSGSGNFGLCDRVVWRSAENSGEVVGYVKEVKNLTFIELNNVGHLAFMDNPRVATKMVSRFLKRQPIVQL